MKQTQKWCSYCERYTLFAKPHFAFGYGCIASLVTGCLFLPVWACFALADAFRPLRCQSCGAKYAGPEPDSYEWVPAPEPYDWTGAGAATGRAITGCWESVARVYRGLPEWAAPVVWGLGIAAPIVSAMVVLRAVLSR
jgi:hypothetical protein